MIINHFEIELADNNEYKWEPIVKTWAISHVTATTTTTTIKLSKIFAIFFNICIIVLEYQD